MDRFEPVFTVASNEDFGETHSILRTIKKPLQDNLEATSKLLKIMQEAITDGDLDARERGEMHALIRSIPRLVVVVQQKMKLASDELGPEPINQSVLGEHHFVYISCTVSQVVLDAGRNFLTNGGNEDSWADMFRNSFNKLFLISNHDFRWSLRSALAIFINFTIGYVGQCHAEAMRKWKTDMASPFVAAELVGVSEPVCFINKYTRGLVSINLVLLSKLSGSTFTSGLDAVSSVVLASVVGQISFIFLGWCADIYRILTAIAVFVATQGFMYIKYLNGPRSRLGQQLAAITVSSLMVECSQSSGTVATYSGSYHALSDTILGVIVMMLVNTVFGSKPSSVMATESQQNAIVQSSKLFHSFMDDSVNDKEMLAALKSLKDTLTKAKDQSSDAVNEPSFWRPDWNQPFFQKLNVAYSNLCIHLGNLVNVVDDDKTYLLDSLPSFNALKSDMFEELDYTTTVATAALMNDTQALDHHLDVGRKTHGPEMMSDIIKDMNEQSSDFEVHEEEGEMHLLPASRRCAIILTLDSIMNVLKTIQETSVKQKSL